MIALPGPLINTTSPSDIAIFSLKMGKKRGFFMRQLDFRKTPHFNGKGPAGAWWRAYLLVGASNCSPHFGLRKGVNTGFLEKCQKIRMG